MQIKATLLTLVLALLCSCSEAPPATELGQGNFRSQSVVEDFGSGAAAGPNTVIRPVPALAVELIKTFEGWSSLPYNDVAGYCTIGYGRLLALRTCGEDESNRYPDGISKDTGEILLREDLRSAAQTVLNEVEFELNDEHYGALVSFVFNIGKSNFRDSTLLKLLNDRKIQPAAREFPRWMYAGGNPIDGLVARRNCEQALFLGDLNYADPSRFDRKDCDGSGAASTTTAPIDVFRGED